VHLVDASPYIFRAYHSLPDSLADRQGRPVNAIKGFADFLIRLIAEEQPARLAVAFDESLTTSFRNDIYKDYKAHRPLPPPELEAQLSDCRALADALGATTFADERYEADDFLATLSAVAKSAVLVSVDKDLVQLVTKNITLLDFAKGLRYGPAEVEAKFGVRPDQFCDYQGLVGDSVDNIPGVKGVGPKSAVALIEAFSDLESLYARLDEVASLPIRGAKSLCTKLETDRDMAFLSRELATLSTKAPVREVPQYRGADPDLIDPLLERLGFDSVRARIPRWA